MQQNNIAIQRVLISVSDKTHLAEFARSLVQLNIEIISTGGTKKYLTDHNIPATDIASITQFPEIMDGRVKTLHPKIHGGILGKRDMHSNFAEQHKIDWIDLVIVNLYPFAETIKNPHSTFADAIENIDIGGPAMIRSASKNMDWVGVVVDPNDYGAVLVELQEKNSLSFHTRKQLATKAFSHTARYDMMIYNYLNNDSSSLHDIALHKKVDLRYGENPHQHASAYSFLNTTCGVLTAHQYQGKELSYNNIADADAAISCVREFTQPACVIVKHANPCGAAIANNIDEAYQQAYAADPVSAFGGIVALNRRCTKKIAEQIVNFFVEVFIAPSYEPEALNILASKPNLRVLELDVQASYCEDEYKFITGGVLIQQKDASMLLPNELKIVSKLIPTPEDIQDILFAWPVLKHIKSNGILLAKNNSTVGIGAGQVSRIDAVDIAIKKAGKNASGTILASDAFFPFRDSIDRIADIGIRAIVQPGGSVRDEEVIAACNEHGIAMVFTNKRCFKH